VRKVDFARPAKFSSEHVRRIVRAAETFTRTAAQRLSAELRVAFEVEVLATTQLTWARAHELASDQAVAGVIAAQPSGRLLMSVDGGLMLGAIELLLGGTSPAEVQPRRFTDIDWALGGHIFNRLTTQLGVVWREEFEQDLELSSIDMHPEAVTMASVSEPTLVVSLEARLDGNPHAIELMLPWSTFEPVAERIEAAAAALDSAHGASAAAVRRALGGVGVGVRAEVAALEMPIEALLALRPGHVLNLGAPADAGVTLFAGDVPVHRAQPGRAGTKRAVQVLGPAEVAS
jgi:flagellar motor switch protein FliM